MKAKIDQRAIEAANRIYDDEDIAMITRAHVRNMMSGMRTENLKYNYLIIAVVSLASLTIGATDSIFAMMAFAIFSALTVIPVSMLKKAIRNENVYSENDAIRSHARSKINVQFGVFIGVLGLGFAIAVSMQSSVSGQSNDGGYSSGMSQSEFMLIAMMLFAGVYATILTTGSSSMLVRIHDFLVAERDGLESEIGDSIGDVIADGINQIKGIGRRLGGAAVDTGIVSRDTLHANEKSIIAFDQNPDLFRADFAAFRDPLTHQPVPIVEAFDFKSIFGNEISAAKSVSAAMEPKTPQQAARLNKYREMAGMAPIQATEPTPKTSDILAVNTPVNTPSRDIFGDLEAKNAPKNAIKPISIGGVNVPINAETSHILITGGTGSGKSGAFTSLLKNIRDRGQRAVVYDPSGEFIAKFYRPGVDYILNPLDARGEIWSPWADASKDHQYENLAASLIPDAANQKDSFWVEAPRAILVALLKHCRGDITELLRLALSAKQEDLRKVIVQEGLEGAVGSADTFANVRTSLSAYFKAMKYIREPKNEGAFSIKNYVHDTESEGWLFISSPSDARVALRPLISMWLDIIVQSSMMLPPDTTNARRLWVFIDELPTLQKLPSLTPALTEGRKYGLCAVLGVQSIKQMINEYGENQGAVLSGQPVSRLHLRAQDPETAEYISREIGDHRIERTTTGVSSSPNANSHPVNFDAGPSHSYSENTSVVTERAVLPAEIQNLPDFTGYFRTKGSQIRRVKLEHVTMPIIAPAFIEAEEGE